MTWACAPPEVKAWAPLCHRPIGRSGSAERSAGRLTERSASRPTTLRRLLPRVGRDSNRRSIKMIGRLQDRLFAACGIASVVLELAGFGIATAGGRTHNLTISSSAAQIAHALAKPSGNLVWVGAFLELLSFGAFLAFAVWACAKLGGGLLGTLGCAAGTSYATLGVASRSSRSTRQSTSAPGFSPPSSYSPRVHWR